MELNKNHCDLHTYCTAQLYAAFWCVPLCIFLKIVFECVHIRHVCVNVSACMSACVDLPMIQQASQHVCFSHFFSVCVCVCICMSLCLCMHAREPASSLTFHPATVSPSPLYISLSPSILHCLCLHQGKCQRTHLSIGLADPSRPGYIHRPRWSQKARGERESIRLGLRHLQLAG